MTENVRITKDVRYQNWKSVTLDCKKEAVKGYFFEKIRYPFRALWIYYSLWKDEIPLKSMYTSNENKKTENASSSETQRPIPVERTVPGDIDELIFPDDEPHYISER